MSMHSNYIYSRFKIKNDKNISHIAFPSVLKHSGPDGYLKAMILKHYPADTKICPVEVLNMYLKVHKCKTFFFGLRTCFYVKPKIHLPFFVISSFSSRFFPTISSTYINISNNSWCCTSVSFVYVRRYRPSYAPEVLFFSKIFE